MSMVSLNAQSPSRRIDQLQKNIPQRMTSPSRQLKGMGGFLAGYAVAVLGETTGVNRTVSGVGYRLGADLVGYNPSGNDLNAIGKGMGIQGVNAWTSISGSIPGLFLNTLAVVGGVKLINRNRGMAAGLISYGLISHLLQSSYSWTAVGLSSADLLSKAKMGHEFANFAFSMGKLTGVSAPVIAASTASVLTAIVPLIALGTYLHQRSNRLNVVPDYLALRHWLSQIQQNLDGEDGELFKELIARYFTNEKLKECSEIENGDDLSIELASLENYLIEELPKKTLDQAKEELLSEWQENQVTDRIQIVLEHGSIIGSISIVASRLFHLLAQASEPALGCVSTVFVFIAPFGIAAGVAANIRQAVLDWKNEKLPTIAKVISISNAVFSVLVAATVIAALFTPGANLVLVGAMIIGAMVSLSLRYAKYRVTKQAFAIERITNLREEFLFKS